MGLFFAMQFHMLTQYPNSVFTNSHLSSAWQQLPLSPIKADEVSYLYVQMRRERAFSRLMIGTIWLLVNQQVSLWNETMMEFYSVLIWSLMTIHSCLDVLLVWMGWSVVAGEQNNVCLVNFLCVLVSCMMFYMVITLEDERRE